jgi:hypothetical protein
MAYGPKDPQPHMDGQAKRDTKRQSAKKSREHSIYTQKAVRAKEALLEKKGPVHATLPTKP